MTLDQRAPSPAGTSHDVKGELIRDGDVVTGWCWSPESGRARLRVSLLIDGVVVGGTIAARLRADLVQDGVCDGYHGFSLPLPAEYSRRALIETRECATGRIFGRILPSEPADVLGWRVGVDALAAQAAHLQRQTGAIESGGPRCHDAFRAIGTSLIDRWHNAHRDGPPANLQTGSAAASKVCLILDARGALAPAAIKAVRLLAPMLRHYQAEIVLIDDGKGPAGAAFARVQGLRYALSMSADDAAWFATAAAHASAPTLIFLRTAEVCARGLIVILEQSRDAVGVLIGGAASLVARNVVGGTLAGAADLSSLQGLCLQVQAATLDDLGGLDPLMDDGGELAVLDFALRAHQQGHDVGLSAGGGTIDLRTAARATAAESAAARRYFASKWRCSR